MKKTIISFILAILTPLFVFAAIPDLYMSQVGFNGNIENTSGSVKIIAKAGSSYTLVNGNISDVDVSGTGSVIFSQCTITGTIKLSGVTQVSFINCEITGSDTVNEYLIDISKMTSGSAFSMINTRLSDPSHVTIYGEKTSANLTITGSADRLCGNQSYPIKTINLYEAHSTSLRMNQYVYVKTLDLTKTNNTLAGQMATDPNYSWNSWNILGNAAEGGIILDGSSATAININNSRIKSISLKDSSTIESISIIGGTNLLNVDASNSKGTGIISSATITMNSGSSATLNLANNKLGSSATSGKWVDETFDIETHTLPVSESKPAASAGAYYLTYANIERLPDTNFTCETCGGTGQVPTGTTQVPVEHFKPEVEACADENGNVLWVEKNAQEQAVGTVAITKVYADQNNIPVTPLLPTYALEKAIEYDHTILFAEPYIEMETVTTYATCEDCKGQGGSGVQTWTATCTQHTYVVGGSLCINGNNITTSYSSTGRSGSDTINRFANEWNGININTNLSGNSICYTVGLKERVSSFTEQINISCYFGKIPSGATVLRANQSSAPAPDNYAWFNGNYEFDCYVSMNGYRINFPKEGQYYGDNMTSEKAPSGVSTVVLYRRTWPYGNHWDDNDEACRAVSISIYPFGN